MSAAPAAGEDRADVRVVVIGAGMSGVGAGCKLRAAGVRDFTIYEKGAGVGGTWRENTYPGLHCDIPSRIYGYSFAPNPDWPHQFSSGGDIWAYVERVVDEHGLREHIRCNTALESARWDGEAWQLQLADGSTDSCDVLIAATGLLHHPRVPEIEGLDDFEGECFHTARWNHEVDLQDRRVGVIGTGATGIQLVAEIASAVEQLDLFQRAPQWILPIPNWRTPRLIRGLLNQVPQLNGAVYHGWRLLFEQTVGRAAIQPGPSRTLVGAVARANLRLAVSDPELRAKLTPDFEPLCKRILMSSRFYGEVQRPNVEVVTEPIARVLPAGVETADGVLHELDLLIMATGFDSHAYMRPIELVGEDGLRLEDAWREGIRAYRSVAMPGFPNFFMLLGPNSPGASTSLTVAAETQADYAIRWIGEIQAGRVRSVAPTREATDSFNAAVRRAMPKTAWTSGCQSWYLGVDGLPELWPWMPDRHRAMLRGLQWSDFVVQGQVALQATV
jgi:cation diffusion facilitator CzcD-associated flavoprotein CzcO